jgi:MFS family permease
MTPDAIKTVSPPRTTRRSEPTVALQPLPPGLRHRFHAMVKPVGSMCNLDCKYCYYLHKEELLGQPRTPRMSDEMLERHIRQYIEAQTGDEVVFSWQGGEPTILGLDFFRMVVELQARHVKPGQRIEVYRFLTRELGAWRVQFISCVEPKAFRAALAAIVLGLVRPAPFLDPRLFADRVFASAALVSLLTGYAFATAIVGTAVFVDRVLYGGPDDQRLALGALAAATAAGALASGWLVRHWSLRAVTALGLGASIAGLLWMGTWDAGVSYPVVAAAAGLFGLGFGLTVTPRTTAAVEAVGRARFGAASATVTVARTIGMAIGLAVLTAYGSTTITRLSDEVFGSPDAYKAIVGPALADRPLRDTLVVDALEAWAAARAAETMVALFLVAAGVTVAAFPAGVALGARPRMLRDETAGGGAAGAGGGDGDGDRLDESEPSLAL